MAYLPLANILHYKLRSLLIALGIGIGICMLVTLSGLSRGSLYEVAQRWESVDADLILFPHGWGDEASVRSGSGLPDKYAPILLKDHGDLVRRVVPVFTWVMKVGGQDQMVAGVDADQWHTLTGGRPLREGRLFDPDGRFAKWIEDQLLSPRKAQAPDEPAEDIPESELGRPEHNGLEIVVDSRLARAGNLRLNQTITAANHQWKIVGIVPAGGMTRVFMPRRTAQFLFGSGDITKSTLMFIKLREGAGVGPAGKRIAAATRQDAVPLDKYRGLLKNKFRIMFHYVDAVNAVALVIAFLFIMTTLHTMVLQRTRDIAILKSCGAGDAFIVRQVLAESMLLTGAGSLMGVGLSFLAGWAIETWQPLLTVTITWWWIAAAAGAAVVGAILSGLYPAWQATRVDMVETLTLE